MVGAGGYRIGMMERGFVAARVQMQTILFTPTFPSAYPLNPTRQL